MSTKTGFAPERVIIFNVEAKVIEGVMISSPGLMPRASIKRCMPAVPDETERAYEAPVSSQKFSSKDLQRGPVVIQPDLKHEMTASTSPSPIDGRLKGKKSFLISTGESPLLSERVFTNGKQIAFYDIHRPWDSIAELNDVVIKSHKISFFFLRLANLDKKSPLPCKSPPRKLKFPFLFKRV